MTLALRRGSVRSIRVAALHLLAATASVVRPARSLAVSAAALGDLALTGLAWTGHATMREVSLADVHLAADTAHSLAAAAWRGALVAQC